MNLNGHYGWYNTLVALMIYSCLLIPGTGSRGTEDGRSVCYRDDQALPPGLLLESLRGSDFTAALRAGGLPGGRGWPWLPVLR
jgi:hypothetical protein